MIDEQTQKQAEERKQEHERMIKRAGREQFMVYMRCIMATLALKEQDEQQAAAPPIVRA
jgi:hypothetical protein